MTKLQQRNKISATCSIKIKTQSLIAIFFKKEKMKIVKNTHSQLNLKYHVKEKHGRS